MKSSNVKSISLKIKRFGDCLEVSYFCSLLNSSTCCLTKMKKEVKQKRTTMKKKMICGAAMLLFGLTVMANPPAPTGNPIDGASNNYTGTYLTPQGSVPLAPATLLLLGLAGGFAGVKMYQNNKQKKEDEI